MIEYLRKNAKVRNTIKPIKPWLIPIWMRAQCSPLWHSYQTNRRNKLPTRKIHSYCIGLPKTGTHSIASLLPCNSYHEPETNTLLYLFRQSRYQGMTLKEQVSILKSRDSQLWLEMESNFMLGLVLEPLAEAFPNAKYVLTVREPYSWLESQINQQLLFGHIEPFYSAFQYMFGTIPHSKVDAKLSEMGLNSIEGYLSYWGRANSTALDCFPSQNLFVISTKQITSKASEIADFVGLENITSETHSYARKDKKVKVLDFVNKEYLEEMVEKYTSAAKNKINNFAGENLV